MIDVGSLGPRGTKGSVLLPHNRYYIHADWIHWNKRTCGRKIEHRAHRRHSINVHRSHGREGPLQKVN